jgi:hypothetical protein
MTSRAIKLVSLAQIKEMWWSQKSFFREHFLSEYLQGDVGVSLEERCVNSVCPFTRAASQRSTDSQRAIATNKSKTLQV